jgi:hypothetical protein
MVTSLFKHSEERQKQEWLIMLQEVYSIKKGKPTRRVSLCPCTKGPVFFPFKLSIALLVGVLISPPNLIAASKELAQMSVPHEVLDFWFRSGNSLSSKTCLN